MPDGPGRFAQNFSCSALLRIPLSHIQLRLRDYHPLRSNFPERSSHCLCTTAWSYYLGLFPGRSPLLGESLVYFLFLQVLRCFSSLRSPPYTSMDNHPSGDWVVPFGNPRIKDHLHLPEAYRSLSRPSSPPRAKASTRRPNFLSPFMPIHIMHYQLCIGIAHTFSCKLRGYTNI